VVVLVHALLGEALLRAPGTAAGDLLRIHLLATMSMVAMVCKTFVDAASMVVVTWAIPAITSFITAESKPDFSGSLLEPELPLPPLVAPPGEAICARFTRAFSCSVFRCAAAAALLRAVSALPAAAVAAAAARLPWSAEAFV